MWQVHLVDAVTKVLPGQEPPALTAAFSGLIGERLSFQVALLPPPSANSAPADTVTVSVTADDAYVQLWQVGLVPVTVPCFTDHDPDMLATLPTLLPDPLYPSTGQVAFSHVGWHSLWVDVELGPGTRQIVVTVSQGAEVLFRHPLAVRLVPQELGRSRVRFLQWLHADALADQLGVSPYSPAHWASLRSYLEAAADMGVTGVLAPLWTPPLDTAEGTYRTNVQLLDFRRVDGRIVMDTSELDRWLDEVTGAGLRDIECPHLFTQWGARATPQIWVDGRREFGWDVAATDPRYREFLTEVLPPLRAHLERAVGAEHVWWHVSDEPHAHNVGSYSQASAIVQDLLAGAQVLDAVSAPELATLVQTPVVATDAVRQFWQAGRRADWVYHCVAQNRAVANRFIAQPATRHRILAEQLFLSGAQGFLHWGLNFYYTALARHRIDPYQDTCAGGALPGGDPFILYPGLDGLALPSLRQRILGAAWQDLAVFEAAERTVGRAAVVALLGSRAYDESQTSAVELLRRRHAVDDLLS